LRRYATEYGATQTAFRLAERPDVEAVSRWDNVVFEPSKCIRCGLCVEIGRAGREPFGMTFAGRGYAVRVKVPFDRDLDAALKTDAAKCVEACPTGALAYRQGEARDE
jgi:NADH dehydrogenase/NADH:ubiquinone oxidoreductase subunit G